MQIADVEAIHQDCQRAAEHGLGWLEVGESLQLHVNMIEQLPPLLRVYVGCAAVLYGDYRNADLVKIHVGSGKVSLMRYDDFEGQALPRMIERVKIKLREQDIDYFGIIRLTYGFCSPELAKEISGRIDPKRDQHAAHELNRLGNPVCSRLGAAVDFVVEDDSMLEVAQ
ncbi:MAG: hypothetical protein U9Q81_04130 [Pseudomonadota bacterium]|nr:hypothetical protein [Pseudomonadota bacterium]